MHLLRIVSAATVSWLVICGVANGAPGFSFLETATEEHRVDLQLRLGQEVDLQALAEEEQDGTSSFSFEAFSDESEVSTKDFDQLTLTFRFAEAWPANPIPAESLKFVLGEGSAQGFILIPGENGTVGYTLSFTQPLKLRLNAGDAVVSFPMDRPLKRAGRVELIRAVMGPVELIDRQSPSQALASFFVQPALVPELESYVLMLVGLAFLFGARARRRSPPGSSRHFVLP